MATSRRVARWERRRLRRVELHDRIRAALLDAETQTEQDVYYTQLADLQAAQDADVYPEGGCR